GIDRLWDFMIDPKAVSTCLPGLEGFREIEEDKFEGTVRISLGPISVRLNGTLVVLERDRTTWTSRMRATATDISIGGDVKATLTASLTSTGNAETAIRIDTEAKVLGRLGEFGQPIMKKTADRYLTLFVDNVTKSIGTERP